MGLRVVVVTGLLGALTLTILSAHTRPKSQSSEHSMSHPSRPQPRAIESRASCRPLGLASRGRMLDGLQSRDRAGTRARPQTSKVEILTALRS